LLAQKKEPKKDSRVAETTPVVEMRNRRGKNSLRSNSLPLFPALHPAAWLSGNGFPPHRDVFCRGGILATRNYPELCLRHCEERSDVAIQ